MMKAENYTRWTLFTALVATLFLASAPAVWAGDVMIAVQSSDSKNLLARCNGCIPNGAYPDSAFVHVKPADVGGSPWAHFFLQKLDNGKYALKSADSGNYLSRCRNCVPNGAYPDSAFVHVKPADLGVSPYAQFTLERLSNGKYAFKADTGNYLGRCNNCIPGGAYPDSAFIHVKPAELQGAPWAQWDLIVLP